MLPVQNRIHVVSLTENYLRFTKNLKNLGHTHTSGDSKETAITVGARNFYNELTTDSDLVPRHLNKYATTTPIIKS